MPVFNGMHMVRYMRCIYLPLRNVGQSFNFAENRQGSLDKKTAGIKKKAASRNGLLGCVQTDHQILFPCLVQKPSIASSFGRHAVNDRSPGIEEWWSKLQLCGETGRGGPIRKLLEYNKKKAASRNGLPGCVLRRHRISEVITIRSFLRVLCEAIDRLISWQACCE
jgi:hypothetical protein